MTSVVYQIPLSCGRSYVDQTGRCLNERMQEHRNLHANWHRRALASLHANWHSQNGVCIARSADAHPILRVRRERNKREREICEAFQIGMLGAELCVSEPSVHITDKEFQYLENLYFPTFKLR